MPGSWPLILAHMLLLQIQPIKVQGVDPVSQKLRRLNEQVSLNQLVSSHFVKVLQIQMVKFVQEEK